MNSRIVIISVLVGLLLVGGAGAGYVYFLKGKKAETAAAAKVDPASFEGEDVEDSLAVETPPADIPNPEGQDATDALGQESGADGDPWLDPADGDGGDIQGSGDAVDGDEPFEDVYAAPPEGGTGGGDTQHVEDPIDPSEMPKKDETAKTAAPDPEPESAEPQ